MEYQRIGAWWHGPVVSTDAVSSFGESGVQESVPARICRVVFGTLLGPEATGPLDGSWFLAVVCWRVCLFLVSWLHRSHALPLLVGCVWGVWFGVVV